MADPSAEQLEALLDLAATDAAIRRLRTTMDHLPEQQQLAELAERRRALEDQHADIRLERDQVTQVARRHDRDVDQLRERLGHEQQRMYGGDITNAKELGKIEAEIAAVQQRIDEHELAELEALETLEEHEEALDALEQDLATLAGTTDQTEARRDEAAAGLLAEIAEHEVVRDRQRDDLDDELVARYDRSAQRTVGDAVGRLDGEDCTACGIRLSYADVNALLDGPPLSTCPNCGRLIVVL